MPRRRTAVVSLALIAAGLPALAPPAALAAGGATDVTVYSADNDGDVDGGQGIYRQVTGQNPTTVQAESNSSNADQVTGSSDGGRYTYVRQTRSPQNDTGSLQTVVVQDAGGRVVRTLDPHILSSGFYASDNDPVLSADGSRLAWTVLTRGDNSFTTTLVLADIGTGKVTTLPGGTDRGAYAFLTPTRLLIVDGDHLATVSTNGGASTPVAGPVNADDDGSFAVSPDGTKIAWSHITSPDTATLQTTSIEVGDLAVTAAGKATISNPKAVTTDKVNLLPAWSPDGTTLHFIRNPGTGADSSGDLATVPADGSAAATVVATPGNEESVAALTVDQTAPGAAAFRPFDLGGSNLALRWTLPADTDLSGVRITRTGGDLADQAFFVPAPTTSYIAKFLPLGRDFTYTVSAVDHSGNVGPADERSVTTVDPHLYLANPVSSGSHTPTFVINLPTGGTSTVHYRTNGTGMLSTFPFTSGSHAFQGVAGASYAFLLSVSDSHGNSSGQVGAGYAVDPYDQGYASFRGPVLTQSLKDRWLGSATFLRGTSSYARLVVTGNQLQVVGSRCQTCGVMTVYVDGRAAGSVSTYASVREERSVLLTLPLTPGHGHAVLIKDAGTAGRPNVVLDGFAVRR